MPAGAVLFFRGIRWLFDTGGVAIRHFGWYREPDTWARVQANAMAADFSWERQAQEYAALYERLADGTRPGRGP